MTDDLVNIVAIIMTFGFIPVSFWIVSFFRTKRRALIHETLRAAIDKGQEISPEIIKKMSEETHPRLADFRKGVLTLALAIAIVLAGLINMLDHGIENLSVFMGIAVFPAMVGGAFLALWKFGYDRKAD